MGWWSVTIMGGDLPLDFQNQFYDIMCITHEEYFDDKTHFEGTTKERVEKYLDAMFLYANEEKSERAVKYQVLAKIILHSGAKISNEQLQILFDECAKDLVFEGENIETLKNRQIIIKDLLEKIHCHREGLISILPSESLFNKVFTDF